MGPEIRWVPWSAVQEIDCLVVGREADVGVDSRHQLYRVGLSRVVTVESDDQVAVLILQIG